MVVALLVGCADKRPAVGRLGAVEGFLGGVAADEPRAVVVAEDVLSAGGTAVDAAVAAFFAMTVTYPVGAGLGGGGVCVVFDAKTNEAQAMDFMPTRPAAPGPFAVPGSVRGLASLHARYGRLKWSSLVAPAEQMARFGHPMSRALATRLEESSTIVAQDAALSEVFVNENKVMRREGETIFQVELATTLSAIRARGAGDFYIGTSGRSFVNAAMALGGSITMEDLRAYRPVWRETKTIRYGDEVGHLAPPPPAGGAVLSELLQALRETDTRRDWPRILQATEKAYSGTVFDPLAPAGDASVVVGDREGSVIACNFTMGSAFGTGQVAREAGVILSPVQEREAGFPAPMVVANDNVVQGYLAIASSGGWGGPIATALVALALLEDNATLSETMAAVRAARVGPGGRLIYEEGGNLSDGVAGGEPVAAIGQVHAVWCSSGFARAPKTCRFGADRRGYGLARGQVF